MVWATYPKFSAYAPAIEACAKDAALSALVIGVIFADAGAALLTFKGLFWKCIDTKFNSFIDCLDAEVDLVIHPRGDWH